MKNQRAVYLLLPLVLLIWGFIGWRVWSATEEPATGLAASFTTGQPVATPPSSRPPKLLLTYADPFRAVAGSEPAPASVPPSASPVPLPPAKSSSGLNLPIRPLTPTSPTAPTPVWPPITYLGVIAHAEGKAQVALLTINGEETALKIGREVQGIHLLRLFRDSVQVVMGKQQRTFYRAAL